jgi:sterol desaturase/sphingolipid hydroxylase (fatty acid hydroxylase superfamily)
VEDGEHLLTSTLARGDIMSIDPLTAAAGRRFVSNQDESCRMFRSEWMERLSHVHPVVPHLLYLPLVAAMLWAAAVPGSPAGNAPRLFGVGVLVWTLVEYIIHRFVFHPPRHIEDETRRILSRLARGEPAMPALPSWRHRFYFLVHGVHHDFPSDSRRLVMPPSVSAPLAVIFYGAFHAGLGAAAPAAFAGFVTGYLCYDTIHYLTHQGATGGTVGRFLRRHHFRHHYVDSSRGFGVSSPVWDLALGTFSRERTPASTRGGTT